MNSYEVVDFDPDFKPNKNNSDILPSQIKIMFERIYKNKKITPDEAKNGF